LTPQSLDRYIPVASARVSPDLARLHKHKHATLQAEMADHIWAGIRSGGAARRAGVLGCKVQVQAAPQVLRVEVQFGPQRLPLAASCIPLLRMRAAHVSFLEVEELAYIFSHAALSHMLLE